MKLGRFIFDTHVHSQLNRYPPGYICQDLKQGIPCHQVDIWGWSLKQIQRLDINQDDMNLILGGNAARLYNLRTLGGLTRMLNLWIRNIASQTI